MRRVPIGDPWLKHDLVPRGPGLPEPAVRAEEVFAEARAFAARRALLRESHAPRRAARICLGSALLAVGHGLLRSVSKLRAPASPHEIRGTEP